MAEAAQTLPQYDVVERDIEEAQRARELRMQRLRTGTFRAEQGRQNAFGGAAQAAQHLQQIKKSIRNIRNITTALGAVASFTVIGILWTLLQWNLQMVWQVFHLPGHDYFGLSWWLIPIVLLADVLIFILYITLTLIAYFYAHPGSAACAVPELAKTFSSSGMFGFIKSLGLSIVEWTCTVL